MKKAQKKIQNKAANKTQKKIQVKTPAANVAPNQSADRLSFSSNEKTQLRKPCGSWWKLNRPATTSRRWTG